MMEKRNDQTDKDANSPFSHFSLSDFKKWMENEAKDDAKCGIHGCRVEPKIGIRKLIDKMEMEEGELYEVAKDFRCNGGKVIQVDSGLVMVECDKGSFIIPRNCIRKEN